MKSFEVSCRLFDFRNVVLDALSDNGFAWLSDFGAIDLLHDVYGLEVTGIHQEENAVAIAELLQKMFPAWRYQRTYYEDHNVRELGWKVVISRDLEDFSDDWMRTPAEEVEERAADSATLLAIRVAVLLSSGHGYGSSFASHPRSTRVFQ